MNGYLSTGSCCLPLSTARLDEALLQNAIADVLADDLKLLGDEEAEGLGNSSSGSSGRGPAAAAAGASGRQEHVLTEAQSFTDLTYSKNKVGNSVLQGASPAGQNSTQIQAKAQPVPYYASLAGQKSGQSLSTKASEHWPD